ncbi:major facilitator superfamily domain-containing protein [Thelonectria olida]|uniref:Major facilitator superfamily domain-containing protein n=1 Tax=Thelonectria olida TaxID=1576542 RepID=A0A9P8WEZ5_9HYPO|nr:major facilitator superfamily domain-containing protein [Thelonectria olida]
MTSPTIEEKPSAARGNEDEKNNPSQFSLEPTLVSDADNSPSSDEADCSSLPLHPRYESSWLRRVLTPKNCRWDPKFPKPLTLAHCILYAMSSTFTVANLYYNQPILNKLAAEFDVSFEESSQVATLMQSGYAAGLIFVLPLGDILERRPFIISLILVTATMWIGLCVTHDFTAFRALSFICGVTTVTPQLMIPLVGDFAPAHRKSSLLSIVVSGLMLGILVARLLSGVVTNFTSWRNIYWFACGAQYLLAAMLFWFMPDYPSTNPDGLNYFRALWSIPYMMVTEPVLIQACLITFCLSCIFTSFWTTLTFLLASSPFDYSSLQIGLFSLTGLVTILAIPIIGRLIDRWVPLLSTLAGQSLALTGTIVGTFISTFTVAGPILQAIGIDIGVQTAQVANRAAIFNINPKARNRVNTAYMACAFVGQLTGTAVGNRLYAQGGWRHSGACSIGFVVASIIFALIRGPRETGWVGWKGGWSPRRDSPAPPVQQSLESGVQVRSNT